LDRRGRPRSREGRDRGLGLDGDGEGRGLGQGSQLLERRRRLAPLPDDHLQPPPPQAHSGSCDGRPPRGDTALPHGRRRPALAASDAKSGAAREGPRFETATRYWLDSSGRPRVAGEWRWPPGAPLVIVLGSYHIAIIVKYIIIN